jgi:hypothetical protein
MDLLRTSRPFVFALESRISRPLKIYIVVITFFPVLRHCVSYGLIKDIKAFYIRVRKPYKSPIDKIYSFYNVFPGAVALRISKSIFFLSSI